MMVLYSLIVAYLLLISVTSILAWRNRSSRVKWLSAALWSFLFALIFSPGRWLFGAEGEGELLLPAPFALAFYIVSIVFGRDHLTLSGVVYGAKAFLSPFVIVWVVGFLLVFFGIKGTSRLSKT